MTGWRKGSWREFGNIGWGIKFVEEMSAQVKGADVIYYGVRDT